MREAFKISYDGAFLEDVLKSCESWMFNKIDMMDKESDGFIRDCERISRMNYTIGELKLRIEDDKTENE